jgi:hypothetical protein
MNVEQLKSILDEYPMSMRLTVTVRQQELLATTVVELLSKLMTQLPGASLTFFGRNDCIIRERVDPHNNAHGTLIVKRWLELDLR